MANSIQAIVGIVLVVIVAGGLLYLFYSRTNAVVKTGYGSLIMLAIVALLIPVFWISESGNQAEAAKQQFSYAITQGQQLYAADCTFQCYAIKGGKIVDAKYNGYTIDELNKNYTDDQLTRVISAGLYNPKATFQPPNLNAVPRSDQYGGGLLSNDIDYLRSFIRSADPSYLKLHGYELKSGFDDLPGYLQANSVSQYNTAVSLGQAGQFGIPVDDTNAKVVTINMENPGTNGASCSSTVACYTPINVKVKVGTVITWVNHSSTGHTVTALAGQNTAAPQANAKIFDSANGSVSNLIPTGGKFSYTVTAAAYTANPDHTLYYFCRIHTDMLAALTIVQ